MTAPSGAQLSGPSMSGGMKTGEQVVWSHLRPTASSSARVRHISLPPGDLSTTHSMTIGHMTCWSGCTTSGCQMNTFLPPSITTHTSTYLDHIKVLSKYIHCTIKWTCLGKTHYRVTFQSSICIYSEVCCCVSCLALGISVIHIFCTTF